MYLNLNDNKYINTIIQYKVIGATFIVRYTSYKNYNYLTNTIQKVLPESLSSSLEDLLYL